MSVSRFVFVYAPLLVAVPPFVAAAVDVFRSLFCVWLRLCVCMADCLDPGGGTSLTPPSSGMKAVAVSRYSMLTATKPCRANQFAWRDSPASVRCDWPLLQR